MSFQENTDDDSYMSESGWHTGSESNVESHIERLFIDEPNAIYLEDVLEHYEPEARATHAVAAYDGYFPPNSTVAPAALDTAYSNNEYQQEPAGYPQQRILDDHSADNPRTTLNELSNITATDHTSGQLETHHHEPRARLSSTAQNLLQVFFNGNHYPTADNKQSLAQLTGLSTRQVDHWFRNSRQRKLRPSTSTFSTLPSQVSYHIGRNAPSTGQNHGYGQYAHHGAYNGSVYPSTVLENSGIAPNLSNPQGHDGGYGRQSPSLQAYIDVPPREDVQPIISSASVTGGFQTPQTLEFAMAVGPQMGREVEPSESWVDVPQTAETQSYSMSRGSTRMSSTSNSNMMGPSSTPGRQGRRKVDHIKMHSRQRKDSSKIYQCIWCYYAFKTSSDMRRHMETQHVLQNVYICMREGLPGLRVLDQSNQQYCILCHSFETDDDHFYASHNAHVCLRKDPGERSYYRDDHLTRHVKTIHGKGKRDLPGLPHVVKEWKDPSNINNDGSWYCGFCPMQVDGWAIFIPHISKHFSDGLEMTTWLDSPAHYNRIQPL